MEKWTKVPEFPQYEISDCGRLRRFGKNTIINPKTSGREYPYYVLYSKNKMHKRKIGQLVLSGFVGLKPDGLECCHRDDDKTNNNLDNLYWGTHAQNLEDQRRNGKVLRGELHGRCTITNELVEDIRKALQCAGGVYGSGRRIAEKFGISEHIVSRIKNRRNWKHI